MLDTIRVSIAEMPDNKINKGNGWTDTPNYPNAYKKIRLNRERIRFHINAEHLDKLGRCSTPNDIVCGDKFRYLLK